MSQFSNTSYVYTPLFCEENIWKLTETLYMNQFAKPIDVLFILNNTNSIALYDQILSVENTPVIWDYHVILCAQKKDEIVIFDFDSRCRLPETIQNYFDLTFPDDIKLAETNQPLIKPIKAEYFLKHFYSDRQHMQGVIDNREFPKHQIIQPKTGVPQLTLEQCRKTYAGSTDDGLYLPHDYLKDITAL